nr:helix-turn-helix domain-containing protein [Paenibacillus soyae]
MLIVDDEVIIRQGLSTVIKWEENGFTLLEPAASAEEALLRIPEEKPDIILTDIRMTGMSGIEMAGKVKPTCPDIEIIILSGYEEFSYAQQAIREGINDYLLKNSRPGDIMAAVLRAQKRIEEKRAAKRQGEEHQNAFRFKQLERMLRSEQAVSEQEAEELLRLHPELRIATDWESLELWIVSADVPLPAIPEAGQALVEAGRLLKEALACVILDAEEGWLLIFRSGQTGAIRTMRLAMERAEQVLGFRLFAAAGLPARDILRLRESLRTAEQAAAYRYLLGESGMIRYEDVKERRGMRTVCSLEEEEALTAVLRSGDKAKLDRWIADMLGAIRRDPDATPPTMTAYLHSCMVASLRWLERAAASVGRTTQGLPKPESFEMNELALRPGEVLGRMLSAVMSEYELLSGGRNAAIETAVAYIREHLDQTLSLAQLAAQAHMNPNYFSELFKKETGKNYIEFVTEARMEWAVRLLRETPAKVSEIAKRVGYEDIKHFNKLFKRHTGETPSSFRDK